MTTKSTKTIRTIRSDEDAPRLMHFNSMCIDEDFFDDIKGSSILLYDDVYTFGNTSEAARNFLILAGAAEVDMISVFSTDPCSIAADYKLKDTAKDLRHVLVSSESKFEEFELVESRDIRKRDIKWPQQSTVKEWHSSLFNWLEAYWPALVPNDILEL